MADSLSDLASTSVLKAADAATSSDVGKSIVGGATTGAAVGGVAATVGAATGGTAAVATALGVTAGAVAASVPVIGAAIGAIIAAGTAIGLAIKNATTDTFHVTKEQAQAWLALFELAPALTFLDIDKAHEPHVAARLVRYLRLVAGQVPVGAKGNNGQLYNPVSNDSCDNPYLCRVDPDFSLTDEWVIAPYYWEFVAAQRNGTPYKPESTATTPDQARDVLALVRKYAASVAAWSEVTANAKWIGEEVRALRLLAGENGPDAALSKTLGVDVAVKQPSWVERAEHATSVRWVAGAAVLGLAVVAIASTRGGDRRSRIDAITAARWPSEGR